MDERDRRTPVERDVLATLLADPISPSTMEFEASSQRPLRFAGTRAEQNGPLADKGKTALRTRRGIYCDTLRSRST